MLVGTLIGVLVIPGLYYVFGVMADKGRLIHDDDNEETDHPVTGAITGHH